MAAKPSSWPVLSPLCELSRPFGRHCPDESNNFLFLQYHRLRHLGCRACFGGIISWAICPFVQNTNFSLIVYAIIIISILPVVLKLSWQNWAKKKTEQDPGGIIKDE